VTPYSLLGAYSFVVISEDVFFPQTSVTTYKYMGYSISNMHLLDNLKSQFLFQWAPSSVVVFYNQS